MRTRITLTPPSEDAPNEWGEASGVGTPFKVWGAVSPVKERDKVSGSAVITAAELQVVIRYRADVNTKYTAKIRGVEYEIVGTEHDCRRTWLRLFLKKR